MKNRFSSSPLAAAVLSVALAVPSMSLAQSIGSVASVDPTLKGPSGSLSVGSDLQMGDSLRTNAQGRAQLLFLDETTLSLAPNTALTLDRFVYDPDQKAGSVAVGLAKGALRFIGGKTTRAKAGTITTPTATIGVRGSSVLVLIQDGVTYAIFVAGEKLCITSTGKTSCTNRQGGVLSDAGYLGRVNPDFLKQVLELIDGKPSTLKRGTPIGSGISGQGASDREQVSSTGEERDREDLGFDVLGEAMRGLSPMGADTGPHPCDDTDYVGSAFDGIISMCYDVHGRP